jgi:hypothetical protein
MRLNRHKLALLGRLFDWFQPTGDYKVVASKEFTVLSPFSLRWASIYLTFYFASFLQVHRFFLWLQKAFLHKGVATDL